MTKEHKKYEDDDGRVICSMDVEGMRWHGQRVRRQSVEIKNPPQGRQLSRSETLQYTWSAILAGLSIVLVFSLTWVLFILFCTQVWFR